MASVAAIELSLKDHWDKNADDTGSQNEDIQGCNKVSSEQRKEKIRKDLLSWLFHT